MTVATWALCADSDEEAELLSSSSRMAFSLLRETGKTLPVPTVETAMRFLERREAGLPIRRRRMTLGTPGRVRDGLDAIALEYGADEVMIVTITWSHEARKRSYELVAEAFELDGVSSDGRAATAGKGARLA